MWDRNQPSMYGFFAVGLTVIGIAIYLGADWKIYQRLAISLLGALVGAKLLMLSLRGSKRINAIEFWPFATMLLALLAQTDLTKIDPALNNWHTAPFLVAAFLAYRAVSAAARRVIGSQTSQSPE